MAKSHPRTAMASGAAGVCACMAFWLMSSSSMPWHDAHLLIRTWPASEVTIDSHKVVSAPARLPVKLSPGKHTLRFIPADNSLNPQEITVDLPKERSLEVRVDLQTGKYRVMDQAK